jgi:hypothetical protein
MVIHMLLDGINITTITHHQTTLHTSPRRCIERDCMCMMCMCRACACVRVSVCVCARARLEE